KPRARVPAGQISPREEVAVQGPSAPFPWAVYCRPAAFSSGPRADPPADGAGARGVPRSVPVSRPVPIFARAVSRLRYSAGEDRLRRMRGAAPGGDGGLQSAGRGPGSFWLHRGGRSGEGGAFARRGVSAAHGR